MRVPICDLRPVLGAFGHHRTPIFDQQAGIEYADQYKMHTLLGNTDAILAETAHCAVANSITNEETR